MFLTQIYPDSVHYPPTGRVEPEARGGGSAFGISRSSSESFTANSLCPRLQPGADAEDVKACD